MATKAYDRIRNANNQSDLFVKSPYWTPEVEESYQAWIKALANVDQEGLIDSYLLEGVAVSFKLIDSSVCCTLSHVQRREEGKTCLLTGWSDNWSEALLVAKFKLDVQLGGDWDGIDPGPRRRR